MIDEVRYLGTIAPAETGLPVISFHDEDAVMRE